MIISPTMFHKGGKLYEDLSEDGNVENNGVDGTGDGGESLDFKEDEDNGVDDIYKKLED